MSRTIENYEEWTNNHLEDMIHDVGEEKFGRAHVDDSSKSNLEQQLYLGCTTFTRLSTTLKLFSLKASNE